MLNYCFSNDHSQMNTVKSSKCVYCRYPEDGMWCVGHVVEEREDEYVIRYWSPMLDGDGMSEPFTIPKQNVILLC
jgi:hypothetical protein